MFPLGNGVIGKVEELAGGCGGGELVEEWKGEKVCVCGEGDSL